jgi:hypothetical protein
MQGSESLSTRQEVQNSHTNGYAVFNLPENDRTAAIGHITVDFNAPIDGAGMHDQWMLV